MKLKALVAAALAGLLVAAIAAPSTVAAKPKKGAKALVVGTDPDNDWGNGASGAQAPPELGDALGQELVGASISGDKKTINFIIQVKSLPPFGGMPEVTRYTWDFNVNGNFTELDGKWTNYSRGVCDPTSGQCPPPRDPGQQPFFVRGNCAPNEANVTLCEEIGVVQAQFDAAAGTITIPVPAKLIKAKPGSKISPAANIFGGSLSATPSAFVTSNYMPMDIMVTTKTFTVPKK